MKESELLALKARYVGVMTRLANATANNSVARIRAARAMMEARLAIDEFEQAMHAADVVTKEMSAAETAAYDAADKATADITSPVIALTAKTGSAN